MATQTRDTSEPETATSDSTSTPLNWAGAVTVHQFDRSAFDDDREAKFAKDDIRIGRRTVTRDDVDELYYPAETVVGTTDLSEAYHRAQGEVVNQQQGGRHGVPSAHPTCVFEVIHMDGSREYHLVEPIGFSEIDADTDADTDAGGEQ